MKLFRINSLGNALRALVGWPLLLAGLYVTAALIGSLIPVNADWRPPKQGLAVYLYDNGVHTSLIFPRNAGGFDLGYIVADPPIESDHAQDPANNPMPPLPDSSFPGPASEYPYLMFGWGDARFYRETPRWADVRPGTAFAAMFGSGESMMHVDRLDRIDRLPPGSVRKLVLRPEEYGRLLLFVSLHFPDHANARALPTPGYGPDDRFYAIDPNWRNNIATEFQYSALFTCNNWVSHALRRAGIRTGYWTPLPFGVMWWY